MVSVRSLSKQSSWILRYVFRDVKGHKLRTLIGILSIGLSIGLLVAMNATVDTIGNTYVDLILNTSQDYDFEINPINSVNYIENYTKLSTKTEQLSEIKQTTPRFISSATMMIVLDQENVTHNLFQLPASIIGLNISNENAMSLGSFDPVIDTNIGTNKCLLIGNFGKNIQTVLNNNLSINYFEILFNNPITGDVIEQRLEIAKVINEENKLPVGFNQIVVDLKEIQYWIGQDEVCTSLLGKFSEPVYSVIDPEGSITEAKRIAIEIQSVIGIEDYSVSVPKAQALESADFTGIRLMLNFIGIVILILSTILIYSLNTVSIQEKTREYAMLRTLGIKDSKLLIILFINQLISIILGVIVGIVVGLVLSNFITSMLFSSLEDFTLTITESTLISSIVIGILAGIFSAIKPSLSLLNKNIVISLEFGRNYIQEYSIKRDRKISKTMSLLGIGMASMGSVFFIILPLLNFFDDPILTQLLFLGLLLSFLFGMVLLVVGIFSPIFERLLLLPVVVINRFRKIGLMTRTFLIKNKRRNSLTATIFSLSFAFILYLSMSSIFEAHVVMGNLQHYYGADLVIQSSGLQGSYVDPEVIKYLKHHENVSAVSYVSTGNIPSLIGCQIILGDMALFSSIRPSGIYCIPNNDFDKSLLEAAEISPSNSWSDVTTNNTIIISRSIATELNKGIGDFIRLKISSPIQNLEESYGKNLNLSIVGIVDRMHGFTDVHTSPRFSSSSAVFVSNSTWNSIVNNRFLNSTDQQISENFIERVFIKSKQGTSESYDSLQEGLFLEYGLSILPIRIDQYLNTLTKQLEEQRGQLSVILSLSLIIAFFAIFSSTQTSIIESLREIAVIKAIGLKERNITMIFILHAFVLTIVSTVLGGIVGYGLAFISFLQSAIPAELPIVLLPIDSIIINIYIVSIILSIIGTYIPVRVLKNKEPSVFLRNI